MGTRKQSARLRQKTLERLHATLIERQRRLLEGDDAHAAGDATNLRYETADEIEMASNLSDREILCRVAEHHCQELAGIGEAFRKMKDGTYGICEECDARIRAARLRALPYARLCVRCQRERERSADVEDGIERWGTIGPSRGDDSPAQFHSIRTTARR